MNVAPWVESVVAALVVGSGLFSLAGAVGMVRMRDFFQRMHPPALGYTLAAWCAAFASIFYFSALAGRPSLRALAITILLSITVPVTTLLLSRAALFRGRRAGARLPPPLGNGQ